MYKRQGQAHRPPGPGALRGVRASRAKGAAGGQEEEEKVHVRDARVQVENLLESLFLTPGRFTYSYRVEDMQALYVQDHS